MLMENFSFLFFAGDPAKPKISVPDDGKERVIALEDYVAKDSQQLDFKKDDIIVVIQKFPTGWWKGEFQGRQGVFPQKTVRLLNDSKDDKNKKHRRGRSQTNKDPTNKKRRAESKTGTPPLTVPPTNGEDGTGSLSAESSFDGSQDDDDSDPSASASVRLCTFFRRCLVF